MSRQGGLRTDWERAELQPSPSFFLKKSIRNHYELICQKASASERRVHQDPPVLIDLLSDHASIRSDAINNGWTLLEIDSPDVWERKIDRQQDFPAEILKAQAA